MKNKYLLIAFSALLALICLACGRDNDSLQMKDYYNSVIREISSPCYYGRSLYNGGSFKTAEYLVKELQSFGVKPCKWWKNPGVYPEITGLFGAAGTVSQEVADTIFPIVPEEMEKYFQRFTFPMNTQRGDVIFRVDGKDWNPTVDFVYKEFSPTADIQGEIVFLEDTTVYTHELFVKTLNGPNYKGKFVVVDADRFLSVFGKRWNEPYKTALVPLTEPSGVILEYDHRPGYFKSRSSFTTHCPTIAVQKPFPRTAKTAYSRIDAQMRPYPARNVIAQIPGKTKPEEYILFTAHYDHLGIMGRDNVFPGGNDNASGVAMVLSLAKYFSQPQNTPDRSFIFMLFDAEEANLLGSFFFTQNPWFPLKGIKAMFNFDMIGDIAENPCDTRMEYEVSASGKHLEDALLSFEAIKNSYGKIVKNELSDNSDNFAFDNCGVPVIYIAQDGKYYKDYHSPRDTFNLDASANFEVLFDYARKTAVKDF